MKYLPFIARAPSFEEEDKNRSAALLHFILVATIIANIAAILSRPFLLDSQTLGPVSSNLAILLVQIGLFVLMWKGRVRIAGFMLTVFLWLVPSLGAYTDTGILNPVFGIQMVVIVIAGLLIGEWAALFFAVLSSAFGLWLVQIAEAGGYIQAVGTITAQVTWTNDTTAFILTGLLLFLSLRTLRSARNRAAIQVRRQHHINKRYHSLVESAPDTIFTLDRDHRITFLSRSSPEPAESLIGRDIYEFLHPDAWDSYRAAVNRVLESGSTEKIEMQNLRLEEHQVWYSVRFAPIREDGKVVEVTAVSTDITEHKQVEAVLRAGEARYHRALDSLMEGAEIIDFDWRYLYVNDAVAGHGRQTKEVLLRSTVIELYPGIENTEMFAALRTCMEERIPQHIDTEFTFPDGTKTWFEMSIQPVPEGIFILSLDITEQKRAENGLRESAARLSGMIELARDAIITIGENQQILQFNRAAETMFQTSAAEIINQPLVKLIPEQSSDIRGESVPGFGHSGVTDRHVGMLATITGLRADGEEFPIEASISQVEMDTIKFYTVILRDISERKRSEENLLRSEELFSTIFQSVPVAIGIISFTTGRTINVNDYMLKLTGFATTEIVGIPVAEAPYWTRVDQWQTLSQPVREGGSTNGIEMEWRTQSGKILTMLGSAIQVEIDGAPCLLGLALDISERKQAERSRLEVYKEREVLELKEHFISTMSHEFRTPLAVILSANELLRHYYDRLDPERREEHFQNVEDQIKLATNLLDDVLTLSKEHAGKMLFTPVPMNLVISSKKFFEQMQTTDSTHHEFVFVTDGEIGEIMGDENLLQHILINLISNAIKYSPDGGEVRFDVRRDNDEAVIQISDQGIGIPEDDQKHLFEPFYRASNTRSIKGTGLGLAIVKECVETHQGTITCRSASGQGTTFVIHLPVRAQVPAGAIASHHSKIGFT